MLPWDPLWRLRHVGYPVSPRGYRGLPAFASLSMAGSAGIGYAIIENWGFPEELAKAVEEQDILEASHFGLPDLRDLLIVGKQLASFSPDFSPPL